MTDNSRSEFLPGFQGSRTTGADVKLYSTGTDPIIQNAGGRLDLTGRFNSPNDAPSVVGVSTAKALGAASGTFSISVKAPDHWGRSAPDLIDRIVDDDWIDISFSVFGRRYHVLRGLVDAISCDQSWGAAGAPSRVYTISGKDHGSVFEKVPVWFNHYAGEGLPGVFAVKAFGSPVNLRDPVGTLQGIQLFMQESERSRWVLPGSMGGIGGQQFRAFSDSGVFTTDNPLRFHTADFDPSPARIAGSLQFLNPQSPSLWAFMQEWADLPFCEMFFDLVTPDGEYIDPGEHRDDESTQMALIFRNKPFPTTGAKGDTLWRSLPTTEIPNHYVSARNLGRGGAQRYNAYFVSPQALPEMASVDLYGPTWDLGDIERHGMRRMTVESRYFAQEATLGSMTTEQRDLIRDFNCLNPYLLNGQLTLGSLFPGIRVGTRLRIADPRVEHQETYYVEHVSHSWRPGSVGRTVLGVTRGWRGSDESYMNALRYMAGRYSSPATNKTPPVKAVSQGQLSVTAPVGHPSETIAP